ncbi:Fc.00g058990.m01.CDS01 [Cosmosporella sp. VM-42]
MATKREFEQADDGEVPEPESKRSKKQGGKKRQHQNSGIDATWGQKYVFSNDVNATTIPAGEESEFEDDGDAMAYLNSVRQEANGIPHLLVAPKVQIGPQLPADLKRDEDSGDDDNDEPLDRSIYTNGVGDSRGYYQDGAYMAIPETWEKSYYDLADPCEEQDEYAEELALHEAYFTAMMDHYLHLRIVLNATPPPNAASRLSSSQPTAAAPFGRSASTTALWARVLRTTDPHPLQLALMSKDTIISIIRILLGGKFLRRGYPLPERTSRWIWALLARLPEKGELNHNEIGWVRDLGRRAVLLGTSLAEMAALRDELEEGGLGAHEGVDGSSSDEDVLADAEEEEVEGADSPGDEQHDDSTVPEPIKTELTSPKDNPEAGEALENTTQSPLDTTKPSAPPSKEGKEDGEASDSDSDIAMDIESASDAEDGEVAEQPPEDLEAVKARLLSQLNTLSSESDNPRAEEEMVRERLRMNMRATLNMILTVTGEFYGQRDLLEFRQPFVGM